MDRNKPCYCGSGKKYKKCHLLKEIKESKGELEGFSLHPKSAYIKKDSTWVDLGLKNGDKWPDVKRKYRELAKKYHPDTSKGKEKHFARIQECYEEMKAFRESAKKQGVEYP